MIRKFMNKIFGGRTDYIAKLFPDIKIPDEINESVSPMDNFKLVVYESLDNGDIENEQGKIILESLNEINRDIDNLL